VLSPPAAVPALAAVRRLGIRIPEQLSVIAFNDSPIASYLEPPLTTVHMPLAEMARGAVDCLLQGIDGGAPKSFVVRTPPTLVERESTGPAPGAA
jgi:LacI family transcriptional regulator, galactose operon repressor